MADQTMTCPHCGLPPTPPEVCTPEIHEAIEQQIAQEWALYLAGYAAGKRHAQEAVPSGAER